MTIQKIKYHRVYEDVIEQIECAGEKYRFR